MSRLTAALLMLVLVGGVACGKRVPERTAASPGSPDVSWILMSGDRENPDRDFICQSNPRTACEMSASRPSEQVFAHLYVYYHPAATETLYTGSIRVGFFAGDAASQEIKPKISVKPNERSGESDCDRCGGGYARHVSGDVRHRRDADGLNHRPADTGSGRGSRQVRRRITSRSASTSSRRAACRPS